MTDAVAAAGEAREASKPLPRTPSAAKLLAAGILATLFGTAAVAQQPSPLTAAPVDAAATPSSEVLPVKAKAGGDPEEVEAPSLAQDAKPDEKAESGEKPSSQPDDLAAAVPTALAPDDEAATPRVEPPGVDKPPFSGSYTRQIKIVVPDYHGIEPDIGLRYDSSSGIRAGGLNAGLAGIGWKLTGVPDIVRTTHGGGAPKFSPTGDVLGTNDTFELDGQEMFRCSDPNPEPAASCLTGGNFATRTENWLKIRCRSEENEWRVWSKDGTRSTFASVSNWLTETTSPADLRLRYRWLLSEVVDVNGNTVTYNYSCGETPLCEPRWIRLQQEPGRVQIRRCRRGRAQLRHRHQRAEDEAPVGGDRRADGGRRRQQDGPGLCP